MEFLIFKYPGCIYNLLFNLTWFMHKKWNFVDNFCLTTYYARINKNTCTGMSPIKIQYFIYKYYNMVINEINPNG